MTLEDFLREWHGPAPHITAFTSGSTGTPKAVALSRADMLLSARSTNAFFGITAASRLHCPLAFDYIAAKMMAVRALAAGARLTCEPPTARPLAGVEGTVHLLPVVPMQVEGLLQRLAEAPEALQVANVIVGGAPLEPHREEALRAAGLRAFATYGMTETSSHVALRPLGEELFRALPGFSFSLDGRGCLVVEHPGMSWRRLVTNDAVELRSPHTFRWLGRADHVINSGGVKVHPARVEEAASRAGLTGLFYVTGRPDARLGSRVVLVVDSATPLSPDGERELLEALRAALPPYHAPRELERRPLKLTSRGKLIRE